MIYVLNLSKREISTKILKCFIPLLGKIGFYNIIIHFLFSRKPDISISIVILNSLLLPNPFTL